MKLLLKGEQLALEAAASPSNATDNSGIWTTSNADVATVRDGVVVATGYGLAIITATSGEHFAMCENVVYDLFLNTRV